jgi:hypothetical protein
MRLFFEDVERRLFPLWNETLQRPPTVSWETVRMRNLCEKCTTSFENVTVYTLTTQAGSPPLFRSSIIYFSLPRSQTRLRSLHIGPGEDWSCGQRYGARFWSRGMTFFPPPNTGLWIRIDSIRIRIHKVTESGSNPDPQPCLQVPALSCSDPN